MKTLCIQEENIRYCMVMIKVVLKIEVNLTEKVVFDSKNLKTS